MSVVARVDAIEQDVAGVDSAMELVDADGLVGDVQAAEIHVANVDRAGDVVVAGGVDGGVDAGLEVNRAGIDRAGEGVGAVAGKTDAVAWERMRRR